MDPIEKINEKINREVSHLLQRCSLCPESDPLAVAFTNAFNASYNMLESVINKGLVEPTPEGQVLLEMLGDKLVGKDSRLINPENLKKAFDLAKQGANVLIVQNHTSGADTVGWNVLVNRTFPNNPANDFAYVSGHIVNIYPVPFILSSGVRRFQIFSNRYKGICDQIGVDENNMKQQNKRALLSLKSFVSKGGKFVGLYPEGGRGDAALKYGDPNTAVIPRIMASKNKLFILPTYVEGATSILPVHRGSDEYNDFLQYIQPGNVTVTCGEPIPWDAIQSDDNEAVHASIMYSIANLSPTKLGKGPWI